MWKPITILIAFVLLNGILLSLVPGVYAQDAEENWSEPSLIFEDTGNIHTPAIVSDQNGGIHLIWSYIEQLNGLSDQIGLPAIFYTQWENSNWTYPNDVVATESINSPSAVVDPFGIIHLVWQGPSNLLYYSNSPVNSATSATKWQPPVAISESNSSSQIIVDKNGKLHLVYGGKGDAGAYYQSSNDNGKTWSSPVSIAVPSSLSATVDYARVGLGGNGTIHVVWTEYQLPNGWPPLGVYYSNSQDGGVSWSAPFQLDGKGYDQADLLVVNDKVIHVTWNGMAGVQGRYHRWSSDGGETWSESDVISEFGGTEGPPQMVTDSEGQIHLITTYNGCVWHYLWQNPGWSEPKCLSNAVTNKDSIVEEAVIGITGGKRLFVVFWVDRIRLWYTTLELSIPAIKPIPFSTQIHPPKEKATNLAPSTSIPTASVTQALILKGGNDIKGPVEASDLNFGIILGIISAGILVGAFVVIRIGQILK